MGGVAGEVLHVGKGKISIRNEATNRKKTFAKDRAVALPPAGSLIQAKDGTWHKVSKRNGTHVTLAPILVLDGMYIFIYLQFVCLQMPLFACR